MVFLLIFKITTPLSDYLQTTKLDYVQAWRLVSTAQNELEAQAENIYLELELSSKRVRKIKKMPGELADEEETAVTEEDKFRIKVFNVIVDKLNQSMTNRFADHKNLYLHLSCFDRKRFSELKKGLTSNAFDKICDLIPTIDKRQVNRRARIVCLRLFPDIFVND
ncbi:hypothetical protein PR048_020023 [Dryococelus australis]|uniref:Uncharacterized protein n=1 Tax=Dryococelus australis TaxID=614101 RepID=A0ABQ9H587_9NEOP|nr:hypothetical protein PR048_020023 [Dryococelus australis]